MSFLSASNEAQPARIKHLFHVAWDQRSNEKFQKTEVATRAVCDSGFSGSLSKPYAANEARGASASETGTETHSINEENQHDAIST